MSILHVLINVFIAFLSMYLGYNCGRQKGLEIGHKMVQNTVSHYVEVIKNIKRRK